MTDSISEKPARKLKRKLSDISFEHDGAHVALVSKEQGGPATGHNYSLVLKSTNFSKEFVEKMQQVQVTLELPEFLRKFFGVYYEDAEVLARFMGYEPPEQPTEYSYDTYIQDKLDSFKVLKSMHEGNLLDTLKTLDESAYLKLLQDQSMLEKALISIEKSKITKETKINKETNMPVQKVETENTVEMVEKAQLTVLEKALADQKEALEKALATVAKFELDAKEAIVKSKTAAISAVVKNEEHAAILTKACLELESEDDFGAFLAAITSMQNSIETSDAFVEKGANAQEAEPAIKESLVAKSLKAQLAAKK